MSEEAAVRTEIREDGIALITLNRPEKRNALSTQVREELTATLEKWRDDGTVRVVVLTGAPPAFCAGFDLEEFGQPALARRIRYSSTRYHHAVWSFSKPLVAAVNGSAFGGGLARDLCLTGRRIGAEEAERIGLVSRVVEPDRLLSPRSRWRARSRRRRNAASR